MRVEKEKNSGTKVYEEREKEREREEYVQKREKQLRHLGVY